MRFRPLQLLLIFAVLMTFAGCASRDQLKVVRDQNGVYRIENPDLNPSVSGLEKAVRENDGRLVESSERAIEILNSKKSVSDVQSAIDIRDCWIENLYRAALAQKRAQTQIQALRWDDARQSLAEARSRCARLAWMSHQSYLEAVVAQNIGDMESAKSKLKEFLDFSASTEPFDFAETIRSPELILQRERTTASELAFYRERSRLFLSGESADLPLSQEDEIPQTAKMYSNNMFRPGGSHAPGFAIVPAVGYSTFSGLLGGLTLYKSWGKYSILPSALFTSEVGGVYSLQVRRSVYESLSRDLNVDVLAYGSSWKQVSIQYDRFGLERDRRVVGEGVNFGAGAGATYRFLFPSLGISAQLIGEQNTRLDTFKIYGSLFGFYDLTEGIDVFAGMVRNDPIVGLTFNFVQFGYSLRDQGVRLYLMGMSF